MPEVFYLQAIDGIRVAEALALDMQQSHASR